MLYLSYYSLKEKPFQETANPQFMWFGKRHSGLLVNLREAIQKWEGITVLTGDVGTGKTLITNYLADLLKDQFLIAKVADPDLETADFFNILTNSLKLNTKTANATTLFSYLMTSCSNKQKLLIIIEEAQRLKNNLLNDLRLLLKIKRNNERIINILLVGQNSLNRLMEKPALRLLNQRVAFRCQLQSLTKKETSDYIRHHLKIAGTEKIPFSVGAMREIYQFSGGIPRVINSLCDHALMIGYSRDYSVIGADAIKESALDLQIENEKIGREAIEKVTIADLGYVTQTNEVTNPKQIGWRIVSVFLVMILIYAGHFFLNFESKKVNHSDMKTVAFNTYKKYALKLNAMTGETVILSEKIHAGSAKFNTLRD